MSTQEKVTLNLSTVDLGKIDYLVEHGFYSTRSDFMRAAIRKQLQAHDPVVSDEALRARMSSSADHDTQSVRAAWAIGLYNLDSSYFERHLAAGTKVNFTVVGALVIDGDVKLELVKKVLASAKVYGSISGPQDVVDFIKSLKTSKA